MAALSTVTAIQQTAAELTWRSAHPFGTWKVRASYSDVPLAQVDGAKEWVHRVIARAHQPDKVAPDPMVVIRRGDPLYPGLDDGDYLMGVNPTSRVVFSDVDRANGDRAVLGFALQPLEVRILAVVDRVLNAPKRFDVTVEYECQQRSANADISNWVDLYGRQLK